MRFRIVLCSLICLAVCFYAPAQTDTGAIHHAFSIQQCISFAQQHNMQVKNALLNLKIQEQDNRVTTAAALPFVSGSVNVTNYIDIPTMVLPGEIFGQPAGTFLPIQFGTKYNATGAINLQQILFDGQVFVGLQARETSIAYQQKNIDITEETIRANIYKIYYQLVVSKTQIAQIDANIERAETLLHTNTALYKNGFAEKIDVDRISVQLVNLQTERTKVITAVENGYRGLKLLMGMPVQDSLTLTDSISEEEIKSPFLQDGNYQYADRNDFQYLQIIKKLNQFNIKRYQLSYIPTLSFVASYSKQAMRNEFKFFNGDPWFTTSYVGINMSVPIFDGFNKGANIRKAKFQLIQTENQIENLKISIDKEVTDALSLYNAALHTLNAQKKNMQLAKEVYNQARKKYENGLGSTLDITNTQTDLRIAENNYINALYDAIIAKIDYNKAIGKL